MTAAPAAARWQRLVRARLAETERLSPAGAADTASFWDWKARSFRARFPGPARRDPLVSRVRRVVRKDSTVVDVGAGTGRLALALADRVKEVVAVDPSSRMLSVLRRQCRSLGLTNVRCVRGRWQDVEVAIADVAICSYVLPLIEDAPGFLRKLDASCRRRAFVYLGAVSSDTLFDPLWRRFHGTVRRPAPTYLDAVDVLEELGVDPDVEVVEVPARPCLPDLDAAVADYRDNLLLPDTADVRTQLRGLLSSWLVDTGGGLRPPMRTMPAAILSWTPGGASVDAHGTPA